MLLPEVYGIEHNISRSAITEVSTHRSWGSNVTIAHEDGRALKLKLRDPEAFLAALKRARPT